MPDRTDEVLELRAFMISQWDERPVEVIFRKKPDRDNPKGEIRTARLVPGKTKMGNPRNAKMVSRGYLVEIDAERGGVRMIHVDRIQAFKLIGSKGQFVGKVFIPGINYKSKFREANVEAMRRDGRGAHDLHNEGHSSVGLTADDFDDMMKDLA